MELPLALKAIESTDTATAFDAWPKARANRGAAPLATSATELYTATMPAEAAPAAAVSSPVSRPNDDGAPVERPPKATSSGLARASMLDATQAQLSAASEPTKDDATTAPVAASMTAANASSSPEPAVAAATPPTVGVTPAEDASVPATNATGPEAPYA